MNSVVRKKTNWYNKSMKKILFLILLGAIIIPVFASAQINLNLDYPEFANITLDKEKCEQIEAGTLPGKVCGQNLNTFIAWLYYLFVGIAGLAAFIMIIWGGIQWLTSGAIPSQAGEARDKLRNAILGLLLILASFLIIQTINPQLTILNQPGLESLTGSIPVLTEKGPGGASGGGGDFPTTTAKLPATGADDDGIYLCKEFECACASAVCVKGTDPAVSDPSTDFLFLDPTSAGKGISSGPGLDGLGYRNLDKWNDKVKAIAIKGAYDVLLADDSDYEETVVCFSDNSMGGRLREFRRDTGGNFWHSDGARSVKFLADGRCKIPGITIQNRTDVDLSEADFWDDPVVFLFNEDDQGREGDVGDASYRRYIVPHFYDFATPGPVLIPGSTSRRSIHIISGSTAMRLDHKDGTPKICFLSTKDNLSDFSLDIGDPSNNMIDDIGAIEAILDSDCTSPDTPTP